MAFETRSRLAPPVLVVGMLLALAPFLGHVHANTDELDELANALRQLQGEVIYRDFFEFVPPLPQWLAARLFAVSGPGVLLPRLMQMLALVVAGLACYGTARLAGVRPWLAVLPGLVVACAGYPLFPVYYHHWLALAFASGALWLAARATLGDRLPAACGAGALVGLAGLCTQTDGVLLALALGAGSLAAPLPWKRRRDHLVAGVLGCLAVLGVAALALAQRGALGPAIDHLVKWPFTHYRMRGGMNDVAFGSDLPGQLRLALTSPFVLSRLWFLSGTYALWPVLAGVAAFLAARKLTWAPVERLAALAAAAAVAACLVGRADQAHVAMYGGLPLVLAVIWLERFRPRLGWLLAAFCLSGLLVTVERWRASPESYAAPWRVDAILADLPVQRYLRSVCKPEDRVVALPSSGLTALYTRPTATPYMLMWPPSTGYNTPQEYAAFWRYVAAARPKVVLIMTVEERDLAMAFFRPPALPGYKSGPELMTTLNTQACHTYTIERDD